MLLLSFLIALLVAIDLKKKAAASVSDNTSPSLACVDGEWEDAKEWDNKHARVDFSET